MVQARNTPKLHAKNVEFEWQAKPAPYRRLTDVQANQYNEHGYFLLEQVFSPQELAPVIAAIDPFEEERCAMLREQYGGKFLISDADAITFTTHLVTKSETLRAFSQHPVFADLCEDTIGPNARLYWDQAVYKKPGNPEDFPWHQDNGYTFIEPQQYLTCWVPLTDATLDNGCPWVAPGLHKLGTLHHEATDLGFVCLDEVPNAVPIPARAGDVVVFSSLTPHRTGPNLTNDTRKSYILQYAPNGTAIHAPNGEVILANDPDRQYLIKRSG